MARPRRLRRLAATASLAVLAVYLAVAYVAAPDFWSWHFAGRNETAGMVTTTPAGIPGDPINVGLVGTREEVVDALAAAAWHPADAITLKTAVEIGLSVLLDRPYADAPVSILLYEGRPQDLAFEQADGVSADRRHHVRFWLAGTSPDGLRPLWLGSASFDQDVGFSHDTGQVTHHIGPDIDAERDLLIADLEKAGRIESTYAIPGVGPTTDGRNGGGDRYFTDGRALVGVLKPSP